MSDTIKLPLHHVPQGLRTWLEIDQAALDHNYTQFRALIGPAVKFCAVVKANAYGHDFIMMAREFSYLGVDMLAVDSISEALRLRREGITLPLFVLGYTIPERLEEAINKNVEVTISQFENLEYLGMLGKSVRVHIKVDTGMHRQGFMRKDLEALFVALRKYTHITVAGVYSHFASAGTAAFEAKSQAQITDFKWWKEQFEKYVSEQGIARPLFHLAASGGTISYPETHFDMVRIGMGLYGIWPSGEIEERHKEKSFTLKPVLTWKSIISEIKEIEAGESVGYDFTHVFSRKSVIAVVPLGYWHGYTRALSNEGEVLVSGKRAKVTGRVSMSMMVIDITDIPGVKVGDEVIVLGEMGGEHISAWDIARRVQSTPYEIVTRINPQVRRVQFTFLNLPR